MHNFEADPMPQGDGNVVSTSRDYSEVTSYNGASKHPQKRVNGQSKKGAAN